MNYLMIILWLFVLIAIGVINYRQTVRTASKLVKRYGHG